MNLKLLTCVLWGEKSEQANWFRFKNWQIGLNLKVNLQSNPKQSYLSKSTEVSA